MKIFSLILLTILFGKGCESNNQKDMKSASVEYTALSRGFYQKITVKNQQIFVAKDRNSSEIGNSSKINDSDWKELVEDFQKINLNEIQNLKSPTEKRFYDGAAIANLKIVINDKTYESQAFDHGTPPQAIEKLVNKINALAK